MLCPVVRYCMDAPTTRVQAAWQLPAAGSSLDTAATTRQREAKHVCQLPVQVVSHTLTLCSRHTVHDAALPS